MANMGPTQLAEIQPTLVANTAILAATNLDMVPLLRTNLNLSAASQGGKALNLPIFPVIASQSVTPGNALTGQGPTYTKATLTKGTNKGALVQEVNSQRPNNNQENLLSIVTQMSHATLKDIEAALAGQYANAGIDIDAGANDISEEDVASAAQQLDEANAPRDRRVLVVTPAQASVLSRLPRFSEARMVGDGGAIRTGRVGMIHGFTVFASNNIQESSSKKQNLAYVASPRAALGDVAQTGFGEMGVAPDGSTADAGACSMSFAIGQIPAPADGSPTLQLPFGNIVLDYDSTADLNNYRSNSIYGTVAHRTEWLAVIQTN